MTNRLAAKPTDHKNPWGDPCNCPWFTPIHKEHVGGAKEAAKIDWLRERPDVQNDLRKRLIVEHEFPQYHPKADDLLPWFMREYNKGRLRLHPETEGWVKDLEENDNVPESPLHQIIQERLRGGYGLIDSNYNPVSGWAPGFADMLEDKRKRGQGIDLMQHNFDQMRDLHGPWDEERRQREEEERRRNNGQVVHRFDNPPGWSVRRLTNQDECSLEGDMMGHCVGSYGGNVEGGHTNIYSLRDAKNEPHATMEINPPYGGNPTDPDEWKIPEHAWDELPMKQFQGVPIEDIRNLHDYGGYDTIDHPAKGVYPEFMKKAHEAGTSMPPLEGGNVVQTQGRSNQAPTEEYTNMLDQFLAPHDLQSFKPWWDLVYHMDGPENFRELVGHNGDDFDLGGYPSEEWYNHEPEDYNHATIEAEERGIQGPELRIDNPDYHRILDSLVDPPAASYWDYERGGQNDQPPWRGYNPAAGEYVLNHAQNQDNWETQHPEHGNANHRNQLAQALIDHRHNQVEPYRPDPSLLEIPDFFQRQRALQEAEEAHYQQQGGDWAHMYNHLGPNLDPNFKPMGGQQAPSQIHPEQRELWDPADSQVFSRTSQALYLRWAFSPATGQVELSDNSGDPLDVRYHGDLASQINEPGLEHGYAYKIGNGWRLTDWDSKPLTDNFVVAQVMRRLQAEQGSQTAPEGSWEDDTGQDFSRMHQGLPT